MKKAILLLPAENRDAIYGKENVEALRKFVDMEDCCGIVGNLEALKPHLADAEIICSGWGMMKMDEDFLAAAPCLKAVFYGAGSVRGFVTDAFWDRSILLTSVWAANGVPVAEWTVAMIVLTTHKAFQANRITKEKRTFARAEKTRGLYRAKIGLIGVGMVGRKVLELLKRYEVTCYTCDPYLAEKEVKRLGATPIELDEMFRTCDVVSLHAANLPSTEHMIRGHHFSSMKDGAAFINTARGRIVKEDEMIQELKAGRIFACIDVTDPEPPASESPLYDLPNVFLTPHLTGAVGDECRRMGALVVEEVRRYCAGEAPAYPVAQEMMEWMG
jgi:phosphoglycerate dehydrogenase-like enzyme